MDVTEFASFVTAAVGPRQTSQPRNPEVLGLRTALVVNSVFFLRVYFTRLNFPAILSKKRPKRSRYIFTFCITTQIISFILLSATTI